MIVDIELARSHALAGLLVDGAHHKQWYLEQILLALGTNLDELRIQLDAENYRWHEGVTP
jgi:hypothetical protein